MCHEKLRWAPAYPLFTGVNSEGQRHMTQLPGPQGRIELSRANTWQLKQSPLWAVLCVGGCRAAPLTSSHQRPDAPTWHPLLPAPCLQAALPSPCPPPPAPHYSSRQVGTQDQDGTARDQWTGFMPLKPRARSARAAGPLACPSLGEDQGHPCAGLPAWGQAPHRWTNSQQDP